MPGCALAPRQNHARFANAPRDALPPLVEARITAEHAFSPSFAQTNWPTVLALYNQLLQLKEGPAVRLSRLVALHHAQGWATALRELDQNSLPRERLTLQRVYCSRKL